MPTTLPPPARTLARVLAILAACAAAVLLSTATASANEFEAPGSGGGGGTGGGSQVGNTVCHVPTGTGRLNGNTTYMRPYPGCREFGGPYYRAAGTGFDVAPVGLEVWRFYGYGPLGQRVQAYTVSEAMLPVWGSQDNAQYSLFSPHPADANMQLNGGRSWGPWVTSHGNVPNDHTRNNRWARASTNNNLTTTTPFRRSNTRCTALETRDPIAKYFDRNGGHWDEGQGVRDAMYHSFVHWRNSGVSVPSALASINARGSFSRGIGQGPTSGNDINYNDGLRCSSGIDFATGPDDDQPVLLGVCTMQTEARYAQHGPQKGFTMVGGVRYVPNDEQGGYRDYRDQIRADVLNRTNSMPQTGAAYLRNSAGRVLVGQGQSPSGSNDTRQRAADQAAKWAQCTSGWAGSFEGDTLSRAPQIPSEVRVDLDVPSVFNVGGVDRPQQVRAWTRSLMCDGSPCSGPNAPRLLNLDYTLNIRSNRASFQVCHVRNGAIVPLRCDVNVSENAKRHGSHTINGPDGSRYNGRITIDHTREVQSFRATSEPNSANRERLEVSIDNASADYVAFAVSSQEMCMAGIEGRFNANTTISGNGEQGCRTTIPITRVEAETGTVDVHVGGPVSRRVIGGNLDATTESLR